MGTAKRPRPGRPRKAAREAKRAKGRGKYDRGQSAAERHEEQRLRLLGAAAEVFGAKGFANTSVAEICSEAGMSRRTFYEHFDDLRDVLLQVHERAANLAFRFVETQVRAATDPLDRLRAGVEAFLTALASQGDLARVLFREVHAAGPKNELVHEAQLSRYVGLVFEGVADAYAKGIATRPPDELTIFALMSAMEAVAMRYVMRREEARAIEAAPMLVELIVRAFK
jgi:AcrR family transcriptional regulator